MKKSLIFLVFSLLFTASCLYRKPQPVILTPLEEKIDELRYELKKIEKAGTLKIEDLKQDQDIEGIKQLLSLLEKQQERTFKKDIKPFIPEKLFFCGEEVPLERFRVRERLEFALITEITRPAMTLIFLRSGRWLPLIERKIKEKNLPDDLKYVAIIESDLNPEAYSDAGAAGLWQFTKDTARRYHLKIDSYIDERLDPEKSTEAALNHFQDLYQEFGDWPSALAGYNMHKDRYKEELNKENAQDFYDVRDIPIECLRYSFRVIATKIIMEYPKEYGFPPIEEIEKIKYQPFQVEPKIIDVLSKRERIIDLAKRLSMSYQEFRIFNPHILVKKNNYGEITRDWLPKRQYQIYIKKTQ